MAQFDPTLATRPGVVTRAFGGWRNPQAMSVLLAGFLLAGLLFGLGNALLFLARDFLIATLVNFCGILVAVAALNAAGVALMDAARRAPPRGITALLLEGAFCFGKFMLFVAGALLGVVLYLLVLALLLYLSHVPFLGPVFLLLVLPLALVGSAGLLAALFVFFALLAPALWAGDAPRIAVGRVAAVLRQRPLEAVVSLLLLVLAVVVAAGTMTVLLLAAAWLVGSIANAMLGIEIVSGATLAGMVPAGLEGEALALTAAGMIALTLVFVAGIGLLAVVQFNGACHLWLQLSADIDETEARWALADLVVGTGDSLRSLSAGLSRQARVLGQRAGALVRRFPRGDGAGERRCPSCRTAASEGARFCTRCGARL